MDAAVGIPVARGGKVYLHIAERLQRCPDLETLRGTGGGRRDDAVGHEQPTSFGGPANIILPRQSESEVQTGSHHSPTLCLSEYIAYFRHETRQTEVVLIRIGNTDIACHHQEARPHLQCFIPLLVLFALLGAYHHLYASRVLRKDDYFVVVNDLKAQRIFGTVRTQSYNAELFAALVVLQFLGSVGLERYFLFKKLLLHFSFLLVLRSLGVFLVYGLQERYMVVKGFQIEATITGDVAGIGDSMPIGATIGQLRATRPVIGGIVGNICCYPIKHGKFVDRDFPGSIKVLLVSKRTSQMLDTGPDGILPCRIPVGIKLFVYRSIRLLDFSIGARREIGVQVLGKIPS